MENGNTTEITNAVSNQIDYTVEKKWESGVQEGQVTFALYRTIGEQSLTETCKVLTFTMDEVGPSMLIHEGKRIHRCDRR